MFISNARTLLTACAVFAATVSGMASAEPLTLAEAIERTLARNPELGVYQHRRDAQQARVDAAALPPPFELSAEVEDAFGTGRASGFDSAETTFAFSRVVELGNRQELRVAGARQAADLIGAERAAAEIDVLAEVARRFIHVASDQEQLRLTMRATGLAEETVAATAERVAAARAPEVELRRARVALARAGIEREHAEHELLSSRRRLAAMWGASEPDFDEVAGNLYALPEISPFESLLARLADSPEFLRFASEARLRDAELRVAEAQARADLTVRAGLRFLHETNDEALVFGITRPVGSAARAESAANAAAAMRAQTDAELEAHRVRAEAQLFELYQELRHALTEAGMLETSVIPEMEAALEDTRYAFERGRYSFLEWVDAQRELIDVERARIDAAANAHLFLVEIERLTGEPVSQAN
jgi:cobalt-zinc-cadmium efflux system outer membrane protein